MTYAVQQDLVDRFGAVELTQLTDRINGTVIDATVVGRALLDADAEIDGYLSSRYSLPLATVPAVLVRIASDIARYRLWADRASEAVRKRYEDSVRDLKSISNGSVVIDGAAPLAPATHGITVAQRSPTPRFSNDALDGY
jgi:phage gp36-like protein